MTEDESTGGRFWTIVVVVFLFAVCFYALIKAEQVGRQNHRLTVQNRTLIRENIKRVDEIQQSRLASCRNTYKTLDTMLVLSASGQKLTPAQKLRFAELRALVNPKKCKAQVSAKPQRRDQ